MSESSLCVMRGDRNVEGRLIFDVLLLYVWLVEYGIDWG